MERRKEGVGMEEGREGRAGAGGKREWGGIPRGCRGGREGGGG